MPKEKPNEVMKLGFARVVFEDAVDCLANRYDISSEKAKELLLESVALLDES